MRGAPVLAFEHVAATVVVEFQPARQDFVDPCRVHIDKAEIVGFQRLTPFVVGLAQPLALDRIEFFQPLREDFLQNGNGEERAGDLDEREPFVVHAHAAPPADSGTTKITATGKVRSSSLA